MFNNMEILISSILKNNTKSIPNEPAIICDNIIITNKELEIKVLKAISLLEKQNLPKHICIGLRLLDYINYCIFFLALFKMKIPQATIYPREVKEIQLNIVNEIGVDLIIQDISLTDLLQKETFQLQENFTLIKNTSSQLKENKSLPKDASILFLSSGTTGKKKLVSLSSSIYADQIKKSKEIFQGKALDRFYCHSSVYSPYPKRSFLLALNRGMTNIFSLKKTTDLISFCEINKIHHLQLTSSQANNILLRNHKNINDKVLKLPHLKSCVIASSIVTEPIREIILSSITKNLHIVYGTNEFGLISNATPTDIIKHKGTVGKLLPGISLKIINQNGEECKTKEIGTICVKSDKMITKYLNDDTATKKAYTKDGYSPGDLGYLTEDGNIIFEGREDDLMIFQGTNIYPRELESVLESHPNVIESAVFPLRISEEMGIPFAVVCVDTPIKEEDLLQWCNNKLGWRRPQRIFFTKKLPRNIAGKVLKKNLANDVIKILQKLNSTNNSMKNFTDILSHYAQKQPHNIAIIKDTPISYKELEILTWQCATYLYKKGVRKGDILVHIIKDELLIVIAMLASARIDVSSICINSTIPEYFLNETIKEINASFIISDDSDYKTGLKYINLKKELFDNLEIDFSVYEKNPIFPWQIAIGSGSTGKRKLFAISHKQEITNLYLSKNWLKCDKKDNISSFTPLTYLGSKRRFLEALTAGVAYTILPQTNQLLDILKDYKVTILHSSVFHIEKLLESLPSNDKNHLSFLKMLSLESSTISENLRNRIYEKLTKNLYIRYGINETSTVSITNLNDLFKTKDTVGKPIDGLFVKIVNEKGIEQPVNEAGLICIQSPSMVQEYLNDYISTKKTFKNGWFYPGDIGKITDEGQIVFLGRADNMMIMNGINIYPVQIENEMLKHPDVKDVIAFALKHKISQDIPTCVIELKRDSKINYQSLIKHAHDNLAIYKPQKIIIVKKIPRDIEGKIKKDILTKLVLDNIKNNDKIIK